MNFFISNAIASLNTSDQGNPISLILIFIVFALIFYLTIFRPQKKRNTEHKKLIDSISKGDEVMTNSGLIGRVTKIIDNNYIFIALNDTTEVIIKRDFIAAILPKGTIKAL